MGSTLRLVVLSEPRRTATSSIEVVRRRLGLASTETTQAYTLIADKVADPKSAPHVANARPDGDSRASGNAGEP
jgi:hypothetical protein